jgi:hypothetical protein
MGKSKAPSSQTVTQTNLPEYARPYFERLMERTEGQSLADYQPYTEERIAQPGQDVTQAYDITRDVAGSGIAGLPKAMDVTEENIAAGQQIAGGITPFQYSQPQTFTGEAVGQYMSPYMQQVVDRQKAEARRQFKEQAAGRAAQAVGAGAFGGSRQAVQESLAERDLLDRMADIQAGGQAAAFQTAQQAFQSDRAAKMASEQAQAAEDAAARQGQLGALGFTGQQAGELVRLGEAARAGDIQSAQLLEAIGRTQMGQEQAGLDIGYQDYVRQMAYPEQQLQFLSSILRGVPVEPSMTQTAYAPYNPLQQALGAGLGAIGLYRGLSA